MPCRVSETHSEYSCKETNAPIDLSQTEHVDGHQELQLDLLKIGMLEENPFMQA